MAKLPFIDEARLLAEVAKVEHTLTVWDIDVALDIFTATKFFCMISLLIEHHLSLQEEEVRRNSMMSDMLFVALSHPLSPYIFSLDDRCKQLTDKEQAETKEKLDPRARFGGVLISCHFRNFHYEITVPLEGVNRLLQFTENSFLYNFSVIKCYVQFMELYPHICKHSSKFLNYFQIFYANLKISYIVVMCNNSRIISSAWYRRLAE